ncbi:hypothetical protein GCM10028826_33540 [Mucilaginibacter boryungensis]
MKMKNQTNGKKRVIVTAIGIAAFIFTIALGIYSCTKQKSASPSGSDAKNPNLKVLTAQSAPGGKINFSVVLGNLDVTGPTDVRLENMVFNPTAGTVAATIWEWNSDDEKGKTLYSNHTCSMDGSTQTGVVYAPTGWLVPAGGYYGRTGVYTYVSGVLTINWDAPWAGVHESWNVSNPDGASAMMTFASSNYGITHGRGFGSNRPFTGTGNFKTIGTIPRIAYTGSMVAAIKDKNGVLSTIPTTGIGWKTDGLDLSSFTSSSNGNTLHADLTTSNCNPENGCTAGNTHTGIVYHLASDNTSRAMVYNHFCACLPTETAFPAYTGNLHPYAMMQIIDDNGNMRGMVGIEEQDQAGSIGYQYQLKAYFQ